MPNGIAMVASQASHIGCTPHPFLTLGTRHVESDQWGTPLLALSLLLPSLQLSSFRDGFLFFHLIIYNNAFAAAAWDTVFLVAGDNVWLDLGT